MAAITYSILNITDCTENLETTGNTSIRFDCSGGGGTVIFCGHFTSGDCVSNRMMSVLIPSCELLLAI